MTGFAPGLCSVTFRALAPDAVVALAAEAGIASIEWAGDVHVPSGDLDAARRVGRITREAGLAVSSYGSYIAPPDASPADFDRALDTALELGARHVRIWPGSRKRPSDAYSPAERTTVIDAIDAMGEIARARGATVGLEYHPGSLTDDLRSAVDLAGRLASAGVFFYWQPAPGLPIEAALAEIAAIGAQVCHLHVFAWDETSNRFPLETQVAYWTRCLSAMPERRWTAPSYAMLEFVAGDDPDRFRADAAVLHRLLESARS